jgi:hypothetical protein
MFRSRQLPFSPRAILTNAVGSCEHHAASQHESGVTGILDDIRALVAEHQRRLGTRVSTRQDRVFEWRDAGGRHAHQHPVLRRFWLREFGLSRSALA